tara:strand:+ start:257 stop:466 length:210 start_codon:yes stop_codon:yes gene_type:complete
MEEAGAPSPAHTLVFPRSGRSALPRVSQGLCFDFQRGHCRFKDDECKYKHLKESARKAPAKGKKSARRD